MRSPSGQPIQRAVFYGLQTLRQLIQIGPDNAKVVPALKIQDKPRFKWRGLMLDVGRHFYPVEFVKRFIDLLALHKMNVFHWHLTEDQGWRIEIKKYPNLHQIGSQRTNHRQLKIRIGSMVNPMAVSILRKKLSKSLLMLPAALSPSCQKSRCPDIVLRP